MTSCTASFQETSANVGDTIHADFTWADAVKHGTEFWYSIMWIEDPNGETRTNFFNFWDAAGSQTLEFKTDTAGTWKCQIDVWQGVYAVPCTDTVTVGTTTSCTASFQETSAKIGDTIHADFTWANALIKQGEFHYAYMAIINPSGVAKKNYFEFENNTGSKALDYVVDMVGTWTCQIDVWQGAFYVTCTDTVSVTELDDATLGKAITCKNFIGCDYSISGDCDCGDEGPTATTFDIDEYVVAYGRLDSIGGHDFYGDIMKHEWWFNGELKWTWEKTCTQHYTEYWCGWTWWAIGQSYGPGTGHIKIFHNDVLLGQTNDFTILAPPCEQINNISDCLAAGCFWYDDACHSEQIGVVAKINFDESIFYTGPFQIGQNVEVAEIKWFNPGIGGTCNFELVEYPGETNENCLPSLCFSKWLNGGQYTITNAFVVIPPDAPTSWPVGVRVWGEDETKPSWGTLGTFIFNIRS